MTDDAVHARTSAWPQDHAAWLRGIAYSPERVVVGLIVASLILRTLLAATLSLSADESYGIGVAHDLNLSYFDHPPLSYWIIHCFLPVLGDGRAMRLPFVLIFVGTTWTLFLLTRQLFGARAGAWAVLALTLSGFYSLASGWALPDGPLMLCVMAAAYTLSRALFPDRGRAAPSQWRTWIVAGLWIGFAGLSKYHGALFVAGLSLYVASSRARWTLLLHPAPWVGAAVAVAVIMPIVVWNADNNLASFAFQSGRALSDGSFPKIGLFFANLGGQLLYVLPWILVPMVIAAFKAVRLGPAAERSWYCLCLAAPTILLFTVVPLWAERSFPHWEMPGWLLLFPVLGDHLAREAAVRSRPRIWAVASAALLVACSLLVIGYIETGFGRQLVTAAPVKGDFRLDFIEWTPLRDELRARGLLDRRGLFVISGSPSDIGSIDQALNDAMPMQVFGESREFAFRIDPKTLVGRDALIMGRRDRMGGVAEGLAPYFESIDELPSFEFGRAGSMEINVRILYGHVLKTPLPAPYAKHSNEAGAGGSLFAKMANGFGALTGTLRY
ncbi:MAG: ArnT family glycosyltransferase [Xanthobacteraceae bacterium]